MRLSKKYYLNIILLKKKKDFFLLKMKKINPNSMINDLKLLFL